MESRDHGVATDMILLDALWALAPAGVVVGRRRISAQDTVGLPEVEATQVRHAVARRRHEFASGRVLLRQLIGHDGAIPIGPDRAPTLPTGLRGSLAHDREYAIAAVSRDPAVLAIGIDIEPSTPLEADVAAMVLRPDELGLDAHLAFTLKEAAYKAWSRLGGRVLDHGDIRLSVMPGQFRADVVNGSAPISGTWVQAAGRWLALVVVRDATWTRRLDEWQDTSRRVTHIAEAEPDDS